MSKALTSKMGALWIQPDGANTEVEFLDCKDLGDIVIAETGMELLRCFDPSGEGWKIVGETETPPEPIAFDVTGLMYRQRDWLERVECPFTLYVLQRDCGRADNFNNYVRGLVLGNVRRASRTYSNQVRQEEDVAATLAVALIAAPPVIPVFELEASREVPPPTATDNLNDVVMNNDRRCVGDCGATLRRCEQGIAVGDSAIAPAVATILFTADFGETWTQAVAAPFAAGEGAMSAVRFYVGRTTVRYLVAMTAPAAAAQGMVAYTDDAGATWVVVNIGGAATSDGAVNGGALWALDSAHIWLAGANGYIWFSEDGGETWAVQEAGAIHAGDYMFVHFADEYYGIAGGAADIIAVTSDGGQSWQAAAANTGTGDDILCGWRLDANRAWIGTDEGSLFYTNDGGATWVQRTGWVGSGVGDVQDMQWPNEWTGFMTVDDAAGTPVATILKTIDGGLHWEVIATPVNESLSAIWVCDELHAFGVGAADAGGLALSMIVKVGPAEDI